MFKLCSLPKYAKEWRLSESEKKKKKKRATAGKREIWSLGEFDQAFDFQIALSEIMYYILSLKNHLRLC